MVGKKCKTVVLGVDLEDGLQRAAEHGGPCFRSPRSFFWGKRKKQLTSHGSESAKKSFCGKLPELWVVVEQWGGRLRR